MADEELLEKYKDVLDDAYASMREDPAYAIAIAKQAGSLINQQALRAERALAEDEADQLD